ncbi:hypothetical protein ACVIJ6_001734 [Bradyrhizobium sp. USDA 4369]
MTSIEVGGVGIASHADALGGSGLDPSVLRVLTTSGRQCADTALTAFKASTRQRYLDDSVGLGLLALDNAMQAAAIDPGAIAASPARTGLLIATKRGPVRTREQFLESYFARGRKSASATLFSNCGYNIVSAMLARSQGIRGPVLTFGMGGGWSFRLLQIAQYLFAAKRVERLVAGYVDVSDAAMAVLLPVTTQTTDLACLLRLPRPGEIRVQSRAGTATWDTASLEQDFRGLLAKVGAPPMTDTAGRV